MREYFNTKLLHRALANELAQEVKSEGHPSPEASGEPHCTRSQIVRYFDGVEQVAVVHQYLRPDGSIGGSGLPDPKWLLVDGVVWAVVPGTPADPEA